MNEEELKKIIEGVVSAFELASLSVSLQLRGRQLHAACGLHNREKGLAADRHTLYAIASSTKAFTAAVLCSLAAEGRLELDGRVKDYLPEFRMVDPCAEQQLTIRDMLCHRSGLPRHDVSMYTWDGFEPSAITAMIAGLTPAYPFRSRWHYQNHMFVLAGELAARVSGQSYQRLVEERLLKPLGMNSTYLYGALIPEDSEHLSLPYSSGPEPLPLFRDYAAFAAGDGSIYSTTEDMLKWLNFQLYGDERILPEAYLREMQKPQMPIRPGDGMPDSSLPGVTSSAYGLGWFVYTYRGRTLIHHGGTIGGYKSLQLFVPQDDIALSVLMNGDAAGAREAAGFTILNKLLGFREDSNFELYRRLYQPETEAKAAEAVRLEASAEETAWDAADYRGDYHNAGYGCLHVAADAEGHLLLQLSSLGAEFPLKAVAPDRFLIDFPAYGLFFTLSFLRNTAGQVSVVDIPFEPETDPIRFQRQV